MGAIKLMRYTNLASTIHILRNERLTLLSPETWNDRNDSSYIAEFKRRTKAKSVLALCFAESMETYHHWGVFAPGCDGVCIDFNKDMLIEAVSRAGEMKARKVTYRKIDDVVRSAPKTDTLPFLKRWPYRPEKEFRIFYSSAEVRAETKILPIPLPAITHITLSPWMPVALVDDVIATLKGIDGCAQIPMHRSGLVDNERWRKAVQPDLRTTT